MKNVLLCSGGRTSGLMLRKQIDSTPDYKEEWITIFCNTGKERNETLDFVHEIETRWEVPIVWVEYHRVPAYSIPANIFPTPRRNLNLAKAAASGEDTHWFKVVNYDTASRNGEPFDELLNWMKPLPNVVSRGCSMQLKIRTAMRYLFSLGQKEYISNIGIRLDESHRTLQILANCDSFEHPEFPLVRGGFTLSDVTSFWRNNDFDLKLKSYEGNCDLCFLKAKWKRVLLVQEHPESLKWWKDWEAKKATQSDGQGVVFRLGESYLEIERLSKEPTERIRKQIAAELTQDIACTCAEKAFEQLEMDEI